MSLSPQDPGIPLATRPLLPSLTSLRALGALLVFGFHADTWGLVSLRGVSAGRIGMALFFVLSGFVLVWTARPMTWGDFGVRRLARIYPLHLVTMLAALVLYLVLARPLTWQILAANLTLTQAWSSDFAVVYGLNGVSWSLSCEVFCYALFPLLLPLLSRLRPGVRWAIAGAALAVPATLVLVRPDWQELLFHFPPARVPEFVLGMVVGFAAAEGRALRVSRVLLGALVIGIVPLVALWDVPEALGREVLALVFAFLMLACATRDREGASGILGSRWLVAAGLLSYAFYLVHELVIATVAGAGLRGPAAAGLAFVVALSLAAAAHRWIEDPARRAVNTAWGRRRVRA